MTLKRSVVGTDPDFYNALIHVLDVVSTPVILLPGDTITGTTISDRSRRGHDMTASSSVATWYGSDGRALNYYTSDGAATRMIVANHADFSFSGAGDTGFSIMAMVHLPAAAAGTLLAKWDDTGGAEDREWMVDFAAGVMTFTTYDDTNNDSLTCATSAALTDSVWHHVAVTYDGSASSAGMAIYVDGVAVAVTPVTGPAYAQMQGGASEVTALCHMSGVGTYGNYLTADTRVSWLTLIDKELDADEVWSLYQRMKYIANL